MGEVEGGAWRSGVVGVGKVYPDKAGEEDAVVRGLYAGAVPAAVVVDRAVAVRDKVAEPHLLPA